MARARQKNIQMLINQMPTGRRRLGDDSPRAERKFMIRISDERYNELEAMAAGMGSDVSKLTRAILLDFLGVQA